MEILEKQVRRAQTRLFLEQLLGTMAWCWFGALLIAAIAIAVGKFWTFGVEPTLWIEAWLLGALAAGTLVALVWTFVRRRSRLDAAIEIDRRFGLKERVSSALALSDEQRESELGAALIADAIRRVDRVYVPEKFTFRVPRRVLLPFFPGALALGIAFLIAGPGQENKAGATSSVNPTQQVKKSVQKARENVVGARKKAEEKGLKEAEGLLKKVDLGMKDLANKDKVDQKQALVKLNDLAKELEKRRQQLASSDKMREQLNQLKDLQKGPADKLADALKNGDLNKAVQELNKLSEKIAKGELKPEEKKQLTEQLNQAHKKLQKMVDAHNQAKQQLQQELARRQQAGDKTGAEKVQQQIDKMAKQSQQMSKLGQMSKQMAKASQSMKQGNMKDATAALKQMSQELASAQQALEESEMLESAMSELSGAKDSMTCKECGGEGCAACRGRGFGERGFPGRGLGEGQGQGARPEAKTDVKHYDSTVRQNVGRGGAVQTGFVDGPNRRGLVQEAIKTEFASARHQMADPLTGQKLPREYREHAKKYFDSFREGRE